MSGLCRKVAWWLLACLCGLRSAASDLVPIAVSETWRYYHAANGFEFYPDKWRQIDFDDSNWPVGMGGLSLGMYGSYDTESTAIPQQGNERAALFLRKTFVIDDPSSIHWLTLRLNFSGGFVAYLNGREVTREGLFGDPVPIDAGAVPRYDGPPMEYDLSSSIADLKRGTNMLAFQLHPNGTVGNSMALVFELLANFTRGPFVQNVSATSAQIIFRTPTITTATVEVSGPLNRMDRFTDATPTNQHVTLVTNLLPGTKYFYQISQPDGLGAYKMPPQSFQTLTTNGAVHWVMFGDSGTGSGGQLRMAEVTRKLAPDLVLHLGDITYPAFHTNYADLRCLSIYREPMRATPFYFLLGNHEIYLGEHHFFETFYLPTNNVTGTSHYYSFDAGDAHFVMLFVPLASLATFTVGDPQYNWLTNDLANSTKPWKFVSTHHPIASSGPHRFDDYDFNGVADRTQFKNVLLPVAAKYGVQAIFHGHEHLYERFAPTNGVQIIIAGGGGGPLYFLSERDILSAQFQTGHSVVNCVVSNGVARFEAVNDQGQVFDSVVINGTGTNAVSPASAWRSVKFPEQPVYDAHSNVPGQKFEFAGTPLLTKPGQFSNLGRVYVNNDQTNLYVGFEEVVIQSGSAIYLFVEGGGTNGADSMKALGNGILDGAGEGVDALDFLENLSFANFKPMLACILGDELADGQYRNFTRPGVPWSQGQGIYRLNKTFSDVAGVIQQFNRSPELIPNTGEQNADFIVVSVPLATLQTQPGGVIKLGVVVGGAGINTNSGVQARELDVSNLSRNFTSSGLGPAALEGIAIRLALDPDLGLALTGSKAANGNVTLAWPCVSGWSYALESSGAANGIFSLVAGYPKKAESVVMTETLPSAIGSQRFFRVRRLP